jgi:hypothetical protein
MHSAATLRPVVEVLIGVAGSILAGAGLWAFLPRGVVLTRSARGHDGIQDVWELKNDSALPVRIRSVTIEGAITYNEETNQVEEIELAPEYLPGDKYCGFFSLAFVDPQTEIVRTADPPPWRGQVVVPGDALEARVVPQSRMRVEYRRDGWSGVFERREITIDGPP